MRTMNNIVVIINTLIGVTNNNQTQFQLKAI
jgi:hypothetical protein